MSVDSDVKPFALPAELKKLSGTPVSIDGYILPLELAGESVTSFFLNTAADRCAFGPPANAQDRVEVTVVAGHGVPFTHRAIRVYGVLTVRPVFEHGRLAELYSMVAEAFGQPGLGY